MPVRFAADVLQAGWFDSTTVHMRAEKQEAPDGSVYINYRCQGCEHLHSVCVQTGSAYGAGPVWGWNGSLELPTFTPSVLFWLDHNADEDEEERKYVDKARCHTFITNGRVQFLSDYGHALAGQTLDVPEY